MTHWAVYVASPMWKAAGLRRSGRAGLRAEPRPSHCHTEHAACVPPAATMTGDHGAIHSMILPRLPTLPFAPTLRPRLVVPRPAPLKFSVPAAQVLLSRRLSPPFAPCLVASLEARGAVLCLAMPVPRHACSPPCLCLAMPSSAVSTTAWSRTNGARCRARRLTAVETTQNLGVQPPIDTR